MTLLSDAPAARSAARPVRGLRALGGRVILPGDAGYEDGRRGHNLVFDRRPAVIVRPADAVDVARAVLAAQELGLQLAVKGGGHSIAGHSTSDGGMVIDLGELRGVAIDPACRVGSAQGGVTAGEYTLAAHAHGLATPFGDTTSVGLGGLTLGGGIGWLVRRLGLTVDSLLSVDLVTADGRIRTVSEDRDPDLFWAIRGGGGNFGVATRFRYRLHPVDVVTGGALVLPLSRDALRNLVEVAANAAEDLSLIAMAMSLPPAPFVPAGLVGTPGILVLLVHAGDLAAGPAAVSPLRSIARPLADAVGPMPYPDVYRFTADGARPGRTVIRSNLLAEVDDAALDAIVERHRPGGRPAITQLRVLGGAMARVPVGATAFAHRQALAMVSVITPVIHPGLAAVEDATAWTDGYLAEVSGRAMGPYANFLGDEGEARVRDAYPGGTWDRLMAIKRRVDPDNVFRGNHNIRPG